MKILLFLPLSMFSVVIFYLYILALASRRSTFSHFSNNEPKVSFAVVVPAHNEESTISETIKSLKQIDYPSDRFQIVVIADNCSDNTISVVRNHGVRCIQRFNSSLLGKGEALKYAFKVLVHESFQAIVVIDADTFANQDLLERMNFKLLSGFHIVQARYGVTNPDETSLTYLFAVGNTLENDLFLSGRQNLGLSSMLRGNGMCFDIRVLKDCPWEACSVVEDTEFTLQLLRKGLRVHFAPEIEVRAPLPSTLEQASSQRIRWSSGNSRLGRLQGFRLIAEGFKEKRFDLAEMGWCLLVRSKPLLLLFALLVFIMSFLSGDFIIWSSTLFVLLITYMLFGIFVMGFSLLRCKFLLSAPISLIWLMIISFLGLFGFRSNVWTRTKRA